MRSTSTSLVRTTALVWALLVGVGAEDAASYYNDNQENEDENYQKFNVCADAAIVVEKISILCDTPGQYYYGGNKYRDSNQCGEGDKVKYEVQLVVPDYLPEGTWPYLTMDVQGWGNVEDYRVYDSVPLCDVDDLWSLDGANCGAPGQFAFEGVFYFDDPADGVNYKFKPKVIIGLSDTQNSEDYNLGGANTDNCADGSSSWSKGIQTIQKVFKKPMEAFVATTSIFIIAFLAFALCVWSVRRRINKRRGEKLVDDKEKSVQPTMSDIGADDFIDEEDLKRIAMMNGRKLDLIDA